MAYGLQVFDSSGNLEVDISSRLSRYMGKIDLAMTAAMVNSTDWPYNKYHGTVSFPDIVDDGTWMLSTNISDDTEFAFASITSTGVITVDLYWRGSNYTFSIYVFRL
jgi:hypothetical protein